jgi:PqqD family protein of HPr-rel-A system
MTSGKPEDRAPISTTIKLYRAHSSDMLWAEWEGVCTLYHRPTGDTHILSQLPWEALQLLMGEELDTQTIAEKLARMGGIDPDETWRGKVDQAIGSLLRLRLLEQSPRPLAN